MKIEKDFTLNGYLNDKELYDSIQEAKVLQVAKEELHDKIKTEL